MIGKQLEAQKPLSVQLENNKKRQEERILNDFLNLSIEEASIDKENLERFWKERNLRIAKDEEQRIERQHARELRRVERSRLSERQQRNLRIFGIILGAALVLLGAAAILFTGGFGLVGAPLAVWIMGAVGIFAGAVTAFSAAGGNLGQYEGRLVAPILGFAVGFVLGIGLGPFAPLAWVAGAALGFGAGFVWDKYVGPIVKGIVKPFLKLTKEAYDEAKDLIDDPKAYIREKPFTAFTMATLVAAGVYYSPTVGGLAVTGGPAAALGAGGLLLTAVGGASLFIKGAKSLDSLTTSQREAVLKYLDSVNIKDIKDVTVRTLSRPAKDINMALNLIKDPLGSMRGAVEQVKKQPGTELTKLLAGALGAYGVYATGVGALVASPAIAPLITAVSAYAGWHVARRVVETQVLDRFFPKETVRDFLWKGEAVPKELTTEIVLKRINEKTKLLENQKVQVNQEIAALEQGIFQKAKRRDELYTLIGGYEKQEDSITDKKNALLKSAIIPKGSERSALVTDAKKRLELLEENARQIQREMNEQNNALVDEARKVLRLEYGVVSRAGAWTQDKLFSASRDSLNVPEELAQYWNKLSNGEQLAFQVAHKAEIDQFMNNFKGELIKMLDEANVRPEVRVPLIEYVDDEVKHMQAILNKDKNIFNAAYFETNNALRRQSAKDPLAPIDIQQYGGYSPMLLNLVRESKSKIMQAVEDNTYFELEDGVYNLTNEQLVELNAYEAEIDKLSEKQAECRRELKIAPRDRNAVIQYVADDNISMAVRADEAELARKKLALKDIENDTVKAEGLKQNASVLKETIEAIRESEVAQDRVALSDEQIAKFIELPGIKNDPVHKKVLEAYHDKAMDLEFYQVGRQKMLHQLELSRGVSIRNIAAMDLAEPSRKLKNKPEGLN